jgi:hypothetical protein
MIFLICLALITSEVDDYFNPPSVLRSFPALFWFMVYGIQNPPFQFFTINTTLMDMLYLQPSLLSMFFSFYISSQGFKGEIRRREIRHVSPGAVQTPLQRLLAFLLSLCHSQ